MLLVCHEVFFTSVSCSLIRDGQGTPNAGTHSKTCRSFSGSVRCVSGEYVARHLAQLVEWHEPGFRQHHDRNTRGEQMKQRPFQTMLSWLIPAALTAAVTLTFSSASNALTVPPVAPTTTVTVTSSASSFAPTRPDITPITATEVAPQASPPATPIPNTPQLTG